jgi:metallo-beta-lactamase class B
MSQVRALLFRIEDIKLIVNSHVHFDHAGGIAELQKLSGARVAAGPWTADVMKRAIVPRDDPQFGLIVPIARVSRVEILKDGETLKAGAVTVTAHFTPGHTPGGTSWTWRSCEDARCLNRSMQTALPPYRRMTSGSRAAGFIRTRLPTSSGVMPSSMTSRATF